MCTSGLDLLLCGVAFGDVPNAEDHFLRIVKGEFGGGFETEADVGAGDNDNFGGEALSWVGDAGPFLAEEWEDVRFHLGAGLTSSAFVLELV